MVCLLCRSILGDQSTVMALPPQPLSIGTSGSRGSLVFRVPPFVDESNFSSSFPTFTLPSSHFNISLLTSNHPLRLPVYLIEEPSSI